MSETATTSPPPKPPVTTAVATGAPDPKSPKIGESIWFRGADDGYFKGTVVGIPSPQNTAATGALVKITEHFGDHEPAYYRKGRIVMVATSRIINCES